MIKIYNCDYPDGLSVIILLEELGLKYELASFENAIEYTKSSEYPLLKPETATPLMIDEIGGGNEKFELFGSGAILLYLAEKTNRFFSGSSHDKYAVLQWLMFQVSGIRPFFSEARHYKFKAPSQSYSVERYNKEVIRLLMVLNDRLEKQEWMVNSYSIADISIFSWIRECLEEGMQFREFRNILRWYNSISNRPTVARAIEYCIRL